MKSAHIIIGQSDLAAMELGADVLRNDGFNVHLVTTGERILEHLKQPVLPDLVVVDNSLKSPTALELCRMVKSNPLLRSIPVVMLVPADSAPDNQAALEAGCDDLLVQPVNPHVLSARIQSLLRIKFLVEDLDDTESVLYTLTRIIEAKDSYTMGHADRVARYAIELGKALGVSGDDIESLRKGGMLHDIGKIAIPDPILTKPGKYTPEEFDIMKQHPGLGCEICKKLRSVRDALPLIKHHHEKLDGSGYPDGLAGGQIPTLVRIITIVDIYDALRSRRSYKEAFSLDTSFEVLWEEAKKGWWDKTVLSAWEKFVRQTENGSSSRGGGL